MMGDQDSLAAASSGGLDSMDKKPPEHVIVPDLAGWRRERLPVLPDRPWLDVTPDWVCEVLSPSTEHIDRGLKLRLYAEAHVGHAWLLDPAERTLEVLRLRDGAWTIVAVCTGDEPVRVEPFAALPLPLADLWPGRPPAPA